MDVEMVFSDLVRGWIIMCVDINDYENFFSLSASFFFFFYLLDRWRLHRCVVSLRKKSLCIRTSEL